MRSAATIARAALSLVFALAGCSGGRGDGGLAPVKFAYISANADLPVFLAKELGLFEKHGLAVELVRANNSTEALNALLRGQVDAVGGLTFGVFFPAELQDPGQFRLFQPFAEVSVSVMSHLLVRPGAGIDSARALKGHRIGTYTGASQVVYLKLFLRAIGLDPDRDVSIVQVGMELQSQALAAGQFDALFTVEPYGTIAIRTTGARVLLDNPRSRFLLNPFWVGASAVSTRFANQNPALAGRLRQALDEAADSISSRPGFAKSFLPRYTPLDSATAQVSGLYRWYGTRDVVDFQSIQRLADLMATNALIPGPLANVQSLFLAQQRAQPAQ